MICHPDKIGAESADADKIYITTRCFGILNVAFNQYKT